MPFGALLPRLSLHLLLGVMLPALASLSAAADEVLEQGRSSRDVKTTRGQIVDYDGRNLTIIIGTGQEKTIPTSKILEVRPAWTDAMAQAESLFAQGDYAGAIDAYRTAGQAADKAWIRRHILARLTRCYHNTGRPELACAAFSSLVDSDAQTIHFGDIPLNWTAEQPTPALEQQAAAWLASPKSAVQALLGASWLGSLAVKRTEAQRTLQSLAANPDSRISLLATAQLWRYQWPTANEEEIARFAASIDRLPPDLRGGSYYLLGRALVRQKKPQEAALALLRAPVLHADQQAIASDALRLAAQQFEGLGQTEEAASLYRELINHYKTSPMAAEAQTRLQLLEK
ncbi:tetratricopeptide repeat protein [Lignipirellula cremea]|uniref:Tetratricopeptide repeat protein n=1 Tax=Lignipirellula cremea TaxID=2528010 RepID=A0A518E2Z9_9BACT|nr:tetratricopeptide repeat protein [Lignipirellula cremea]QDU98469.1 Tetratricopeptide repeat protein [Lignipirellula cremea]